jgi:membrane dipeptidase
MDRRSFILAAGAAGALASLPARATAPPALPQARPAGARSLYVDMLGAMDGFEEKNGKYVPTQRLIDAIRERRIDLVSTTIGDVGNGPDRFRTGAEAVAMWDGMIAEHPTLLAKVESVAGIRAARAAGKLGILYNFQDTTALEGDAGRVATFANLGVRILQLTYNKRNLAGDGCLERSNAGLSEFGREVIAKINQQRVLLDLSHAGQRTIAEGIAASKAPPAITHSGCRALVDFPRNTYDAEMKALADKGGVFGIYLMPFLRPKGQARAEDLLRHLDHAVNVCGEDHVGIGTDNPLFGYVIDDAARKQQREFFEGRAKKGIAAPGEGPDIFNLVEGYNDVARYDRIAADLKRRGWSQARIDKVLGDNWMRLLGEVWGA